MENVIDFLDKNKIEYEIINHPAVYTVEEADKYIEGMDGVFSKTLFLAGKKNRKFYLVILSGDKKLDIKNLNTLTEDKLKFASEENLKSKLGLIPGSVSLFGILNNKEKDVNVYIDEEVFKEEKIAFHPNVNTATLFIKTKDMKKILNELDFNYNIIKL